MTNRPTHSESEASAVDTAEVRRLYHKPYLVNLGEIHSLVMQSSGTTCDTSCASFGS